MIDQIIILLGLFFAGLITFILAVGIIQFGELISKTPDMLERHGDRKEQTDAPARHARGFAVAFCTIYGIGSVLLILGSERVQIIGAVIVFSSLLFSFTVLMWSMKIYQLMRKNVVELKDSVVA